VYERTLHTVAATRTNEKETGKHWKVSKGKDNQNSLLRVRILSSFSDFRSQLTARQVFKPSCLQAVKSSKPSSYQADMPLATLHAIMIAVLLLLVSFHFSLSFAPALLRPPPPFVRGTNLGFRDHGLETKLAVVWKWGKTADLSGNFTALAKRVDHLESNATEHRSQVSGNLTDIGLRVDHLEANATEHRSQVSGNLTDIGLRVDHLEANATEHRSQVSGNLTDIGLRVDHLEAIATEHRSQVSGNLTNIGLRVDHL
jgi:hypothetical protein